MRAGIQLAFFIAAPSLFSTAFAGIKSIFLAIAAGHDSSSFSVGMLLRIHNIVQYNLVCTGSDIIHQSDPFHHILRFQLFRHSLLLPEPILNL